MNECLKKHWPNIYERVIGPYKTYQVHVYNYVRFVVPSVSFFNHVQIGRIWLQNDVHIWQRYLHYTQFFKNNYALWCFRKETAQPPWPLRFANGGWMRRWQLRRVGVRNRRAAAGHFLEREGENVDIEGETTEESSLPIAVLKPWPPVYSLLAMPEAVKQQLEECKTPEDAVRLKCSVNFCSKCCSAIADELKQYTGEELWVDLCSLLH